MQLTAVDLPLLLLSNIGLEYNGIDTSQKHDKLEHTATAGPEVQSEGM